MTKKTKAYGDAFLSKLIACSSSPIPTVNGDRYKCAFMLDGKLVICWNFEPPSSPIGAECVIEPVTINEHVFYNVL